jgi:acyl-coenzyme A thioesterase PaaI-like protein
VGGTSVNSVAHVGSVSQETVTTVFANPTHPGRSAGVVSMSVSVSGGGLLAQVTIRVRPPQREPESSLS